MKKTKEYFRDAAYQVIGKIENDVMKSLNIYLEGRQNAQINICFAEADKFSPFKCIRLSNLVTRYCRYISEFGDSDDLIAAENVAKDLEEQAARIRRFLKKNKKQLNQ